MIKTRIELDLTMDLVETTKGWYFHTFGGEYDDCTSQLFDTKDEALIAYEKNELSFSYKPELSDD